MPHLSLRATPPAALPFVLRAEHHPDNRSFITPWTEQQHLAALAHPDLRHLLLHAAHHGKPVGFVILAGVASTHHAIELRRLVITDKGQGYGRKAVQLVQAMAFEELQAHRLWLDVKEQNTRAQQVYTSEHFVVEGTLRECLQSSGAYESLVVMSMLQHEYATYKAATNEGMADT